MSEEFFSLRETARVYTGGSTETPNSRVTHPRPTNNNQTKAVTTAVSSCTPPYPTHQNGVVCVREPTHLTPSWCGGGVRGGGVYV